MKIKVLKEKLLTGVQTVQNVVSTKITLPILSNILLEAKDGNLKLCATDLDIGISCEYPVDILEEGAITIPAKKVTDIIREMPSGEILIYTQRNNQVEIECDRCRFKLNGLPKDEFPKFPEVKDKQRITIEQTILKEMLDMTSFAVSYEESRYVLNGVLFEISDKTICTVAADGRRLAKMEKEILSPIEDEIKVIIPIKAVHEILRNLGNEGDVSMIIGNNQVLFDIDGILIATRIIEGEFPNYRQAIPHPSENKIKIKTADLLSAIRRANLLSTTDFQAVKFEVFSNKLVVSKNTPNIGESREEIPIENNGPKIVVGYSPNFFIDVLKHISREYIDLELVSMEDNSIIRAVIRFDGYLYLVMPMSV